MSRFRSKFDVGRLALLAGSVGLILGVAEIWLRLTTPGVDGETAVIHRRSADPELIYELRPGADTIREGVPVRINAQGFRDDPFPTERVEGELRIVVLGDSVAAGLGVEMADAFPQRLERTLRSDPPPGFQEVQVLNLGVYGYSTTQEIRLLEARGLDMDPDLVILAYHLNDPDVADAGQARHFHRSRLALANLLGERLRRLALMNDRREYFHRIHADHAEETAAHFARLGSISRDHEVAILVAVLPVFSWGKNYRWEAIHRRLADLAAANELGFVDLRTALGVYPVQSVSHEAWHPNVRGHEIIAETLAGRVRETANQDVMLWSPRWTRSAKPGVGDDLD